MSNIMWMHFLALRISCVLRVASLITGVKFTGLDPQIERRQIYAFFQPCGQVTKLFLKEDKSEATVYFDSAESANKATLAIQQPNQYNFKPESGTGYHSNPNMNRAIPDRNRNRVESIKAMDECGSTATFMYDILGNKVPTLSGDDGESYVAIKYLQNSGFRLFDTKPSKLAYNSQIQEYVRMYLQIQLYKFICKYKCSFHEEDKCRIITSVAASVDEQIAQNSRMSSKDSIDHDNENTQLRRPRDMTPGLPTLNVATRSNASVCSSDLGGRRSPSYNTQVVPKKEPMANIQIKNTNGYAHTDHTPDISFKAMETKSSTPYNNRSVFENRRSDETTQQSISDKPRINNYNQPRFGGFEKNRNEDAATTGNDLKRVYVNNPIALPFNTQIMVTVKRIYEIKQNVVFLHLTSNQDKLESFNRDVAAEAVKGPTISPREGLVCAVFLNSVWKRVYIQPNPMRMALIDDDFTLMRIEGMSFRGLSEELQSMPWFVIRASTSTDQSDINIQLDCTYLARTTKRYEDGTYIFTYISKVPNDDLPKNSISKKTSEDPIYPAGINLATAMSSTPKPAPPSVRSRPLEETTQLLSAKTAQTPTILDLLPAGMAVMVEFHFETYCSSNSVVAFICMTDVIEDGDILEKVVNIPSKYMSPYTDVTSIKIGDMVAIKSIDNGEGFSRAIIYNINNGVYSVAKVDSATVHDVKAGDILRLDDDIKNVPYLSGICTYPDLDDLRDLDDEIFIVNADKRLNKDGSTYKIQGMIVEPWDPLTTHGLKAKSVSPVTIPGNATSVIRPTESVVSQPHGMKPPKLQVNDIIRIIKVDFASHMFYVQTRELYTFYRNEVLATILTMDSQDYKRLENPEKGQSVLVRFGTSFQRGVIDSILNQQISVKMVDIGGCEIVSLEDLFKSNSNLAQKKYCCSEFQLDGLDMLEDESVSFLNTCIQSKEKFTVTQLSDDRATLLDGNKNNLLDSLNNLTLAIKPPGYWYKNLKHINIPMGKMLLLFSYLDNDNGDLYFTISDNVLRTQIAELISQIPEYCEAAEDYHPSKGEICFAFCMEDWCRAYVISANKAENKYFVFFLDFGNCGHVDSQSIRCLPDESYGKVAPLCAKFILKDLQKISRNGIPASVAQSLEESLIMGNEYEVNVLQPIENNTYIVDMPEISALLTNNSDEF